MNRKRRELVDEAGESVVEWARPDLGHDRRKRVRHDLRVYGPAVNLHGMMEDLVDQPHRVQLGGVNHPIGIALLVAALVHLAGEAPGRGEVREDDVAARLEERVVELVAFAGRPRDVELECHGCAPRMRVASAEQSGSGTCQAESSRRRRPHGRRRRPGRPEVTQFSSASEKSIAWTAAKRIVNVARAAGSRATGQRKRSELPW